MEKTITQISQRLLDSFTGKESCDNSLFLSTNQIVSSILDLICSETHIETKNSTVNYYSATARSLPADFSQEELRNIITSFIQGKSPNLLHHISARPQECLTTDFLVDNNGKLYPIVPHLSFFSEALNTRDEKQLKKFEKRVLKPFSRKISKGKSFPDKFLQKMKKNIEEFLEPAPDNSNINELYSQYMVDAMLASPKFIKEVSKSTDSKPSISNFFTRPSRAEAMYQTLSQQLTSSAFSKSTTEDRLVNVSQLYYTTHAMLKAFSLDLTSLTPETLQEHLIELNDILMADVSPAETLYRPGKYRGHKVEVVAKDPAENKQLLLCKRDNDSPYELDPECEKKITPAMEHLSSSIISLAQNAPQLSLSDYARQVSKLHFRYINIHPFSDANGRTGRILNNMLLKRKGVLVDLESPSNRSAYHRIMANLENEVLESINPSEYLHNLCFNPDLNSSVEESNISYLSSFLGMHSFKPGSPKHDDLIISDPDLNDPSWELTDNQPTLFGLEPYDC